LNYESVVDYLCCILDLDRGTGTMMIDGATRTDTGQGHQLDLPTMTFVLKSTRLNLDRLHCKSHFEAYFVHHVQFICIWTFWCDIKPCITVLTGFKFSENAHKSEDMALKYFVKNLKSKIASRTLFFHEEIKDYCQ
jgi:hypothetical protein